MTFALPSQSSSSEDEKEDPEKDEEEEEPSEFGEAGAEASVVFADATIHNRYLLFYTGICF